MHDKWEFGSEKRGLEWFASTALNTTASSMILDWKLHQHKCCAESCTSMAAIRETPLMTWVKIKREIELNPTMPWGWILERLWPILFRLTV
jgi:hypothetical protein